MIETMQQQDTVEPISNAGSNAQSQKSTDCLIVDEIGGIAGLEPTRYGDWEKNGRCIDF